MRRTWKILGTIGSFFTGFFVGQLVISSILLSPYLTFITNDRELTLAFGVLMGLILARWWYKNSAPIK